MVEETSLGHLGCWLLRDMNKKFIPILVVVSHYMVFLHQSEWHDVGYPFWVISESILVKLVGVSYSCIAVDKYLLFIRGISDIWQIFYHDEGIACWLIVEKATNIISTGFYSSIQYGISHRNYVGFSFVARKYFLDFISYGFHLQGLLWWCLSKHQSRRLEVIPFLGECAYHKTGWCILNINQYSFLLLR